MVSLVFKPGFFPDHMNAKAFKSLLAIDWRNGSDNAVDMGHDGFEIDFRLHASNAKLCAIAQRFGLFASCQQRFRGHAAVIQAIPAHFTAFDQNNRGTHLDSASRNGKAGRTGPNDAKVGSEIRSRHVAQPFMRDAEQHGGSMAKRQSHSRERAVT